MCRNFSVSAFEGAKSSVCRRDCSDSSSDIIFVSHASPGRFDREIWELCSTNASMQATIGFASAPPTLRMSGRWPRGAGTKQEHSAFPVGYLGDRIMAKNEQTGAKAGKAASKVLRDDRTGKNSKSAAGSALSQRPDKKK
jgi:hypothetical protein